MLLHKMITWLSESLSIYIKFLFNACSILPLWFFVIHQNQFIGLNSENWEYLNYTASVIPSVPRSVCHKSITSMTYMKYHLGIGTYRATAYTGHFKVPTTQEIFKGATTCNSLIMLWWTLEKSRSILAIAHPFFHPNLPLPTIYLADLHVHEETKTLFPVLLLSYWASLFLLTWNTISSLTSFYGG